MIINEKKIRDFYDYLLFNKEFSKKYCNENIYGIREFQQWYCVRFNTFELNIEDISLQNISEFTIYLKTKKVGKTSRYYGKEETLSTRTVQMRLVAIKNLLARTRKYSLVGMDPGKIDIPKNKSKKMEYLTIEEVGEIIEHINNTEQRRENRMRNILLIKIAFNTGMRKAELLDIRVSDVKLGVPFEIIGKGAKSRMVVITKELRKEVLEYVEYRNSIIREGMLLAKKDFKSDFVFISQSHLNYGAKLDGQRASTIVKKICQEMQSQHGWVKHFSLHTLRHSFATQAIRNNVNIVVLKELLGHRDIQTTNRYTHVDNKFLVENFYKISKIA